MCGAYRHRYSVKLPVQSGRGYRNVPHAHGADGQRRGSRYDRRAGRLHVRSRGRAGDELRDHCRCVRRCIAPDSWNSRRACVHPHGRHAHSA